MSRPPDARLSEKAECAYSGFKEKEARSVVDAIRAELTPNMPLEEVALLAFRTASSLPSVKRASLVREQEAVYLPCWAAA